MRHTTSVMPAESSPTNDTPCADVLRQAVAAAEERLGLRVVVVLASRSGRYEQARALFAFFLALLGAAIVWLTLPDAAAVPDSYAGYNPAAKTLLTAASLTLFFLSGLVLAAHAPRLARPFISKRQTHFALYQAMRLALPPSLRADAQAPASPKTLPPTVAGPAIPDLAVSDETLYLYVSAYERRAGLIAGPAATQQLQKSQLDRAAAALNSRLQTVDPITAIIEWLDGLTQ